MTFFEPPPKINTKLPGVTDISSDPAINVATRMLEQAIVDVVIQHAMTIAKKTGKANLSQLPQNINTATLCIVKQIIEDMLKAGMNLYAKGVEDIEKKMRENPSTSPE